MLCVVCVVKVVTLPCMTLMTMTDFVVIVEQKWAVLCCDKNSSSKYIKENNYG